MSTSNSRCVQQKKRKVILFVNVKSVLKCTIWFLSVCPMKVFVNILKYNCVDHGRNGCLELWLTIYTAFMIRYEKQVLSQIIYRPSSCSYNYSLKSDQGKWIPCIHESVYAVEHKHVHIKVMFIAKFKFVRLLNLYNAL